MRILEKVMARVAGYPCVDPASWSGDCVWCARVQFVRVLVAQINARCSGEP